MKSEDEIHHQMNSSLESDLMTDFTLGSSSKMVKSIFFRLSVVENLCIRSENQLKKT
jgi:hypothetical protein